MHSNRRLAVLGVALLWSASVSCDRSERAEAPAERPSGSGNEPAASACAPNGRVPAVTSGGIGVARIGATVQEVGRSCTTRDTTFTLGEGIQENGAVIEFEGRRVLALTSGNGTITRLIVADSAFRTERGLGVGSSVAQLREAYGRLCAAVGEGNVAVWMAALPNVSFGIDTRLSELPGHGSRVSDDPSLIPDTARVTGLWIISEGASCGGS